MRCRRRLSKMILLFLMKIIKKLAGYANQLEQDVQFLQDDIDAQLKLRDEEVDQIMGDVEMLVAKLQQLGCEVRFSEDGFVFNDDL